MAVAMTIIRRDVTSTKRTIVQLTFSGTYTTGGEVTTNGFKKDLSMSGVDLVLFESGGSSATNGVAARYDYVNNKVQLFRTDQADDTMEELPNATALDQVIRAEFIGNGNN